MVNLNQVVLCPHGRVLGLESCEFCGRDYVKNPELLDFAETCGICGEYLADETGFLKSHDDCLDDRPNNVNPTAREIVETTAAPSCPYFFLSLALFVGAALLFAASQMGV